MATSGFKTEYPDSKPVKVLSTVQQRLVLPVIYKACGHSELLKISQHPKSLLRAT